MTRRLGIEKALDEPLEARFAGNRMVTLDDKNRMFIPSSMRAEMILVDDRSYDGLFLKESKISNGKRKIPCVDVYDGAYVARQVHNNTLCKGDFNFGDVERVQLDKAKRILLPWAFITYAHLGKQFKLTASPRGDYFCLFNPDYHVTNPDRTIKYPKYRKL